MPRHDKYEPVVNKRPFTHREDLALKQAYELYKSTLEAFLFVSFTFANYDELFVHRSKVWVHCAKSVGHNRTTIRESVPAPRCT
jgi:hypothetical protein